MGAGNLISLEEYLDEDVARHVEISGSSCIDLCKSEQYRNAPFVKVNDILISEATVHKVVEEIKRQLKSNSL